MDLKKKCNSHHMLTNTVVTQAAMGGARRSEGFTSEAVFELHHLLVDEDLLGSWRRAIWRWSWGIYKQASSKERLRLKHVIKTQSRHSTGMSLQQWKKPDCSATMLDNKLLNSIVRILAPPIWPVFLAHLSHSRGPQDLHGAYLFAFLCRLLHREWP